MYSFSDAQVVHSITHANSGKACCNNLVLVIMMIAVQGDAQVVSILCLAQLGGAKLSMRVPGKVQKNSTECLLSEYSY